MTDSSATGSLAPGDVVEVTVGNPAHGGWCVARHDNQVIFVRHALPGEVVTAAITEIGPRGRFLRADAVAVLQPSADRVTPPCEYAGPGQCGGCDLQHASVEAGRAWKREVIVEQFARVAKQDVAVTVAPMADAADGLGWRTRLDLVSDGLSVGFRRFRSHDIIGVDQCVIATAGINSVLRDVERDSPPPAGTSVHCVDPSEGEPLATSGEGPIPMVSERVSVGDFRHTFEVAADGFWQPHRAAAGDYVATVLELAEPRPGESCVDLYAGVGLFAAALASTVGGDGHVVAVESDPRACLSAQTNLAPWPHAEVVRSRVDDALGVARRRDPRTTTRRRPRRPRPAHPALAVAADVVVLDPPRAGAGAGIVAAIAARTPRAVVYVACDPASLARDSAVFATHGYHLQHLRAFDAFPMTHHVETIALFQST